MAERNGFSFLLQVRPYFEIYLLITYYLLILNYFNVGFLIEWEAMYLYPALHPHYHQSQIDFGRLPPNVDKIFPKYGTAKAYEVRE